MTKYQTNPNMTYTEKVMNWFHKVNELYDGTLNKIHHLFYSTDITTNETFTLYESMKQEYRISFVDTMENKSVTMKKDVTGKLFIAVLTPTKLKLQK